MYKNTTFIETLNQNWKQNRPLCYFPHSLRKSNINKIKI